jgi:ubiquinone/menaquinone biosynthesis C-methylase UbiE
MSIELPKKGKDTWFEGTTNMSVPKEGRGLEEYEKSLGFRRDEIIGKVVLDLGSGPTERLSREMKEHNLGATVISLNPDYKDQDFRAPAVENSAWQKASVAALGQALPFADSSFDEVLALYSVSHYVDHMDDVLREIYRVLKPDGVARIAPIRTERLSQGFESQWQSLIPDAELFWEEFDPYWEEGQWLRLVIRKPKII